MLGHAHAYLNWVDEVQFSAHLLTSRVSSEIGYMADNAVGDEGPHPNGTDPLYADDTTDDYTPDGNLSVYGVDGRFDLDSYGYLYLGASQIRAKYAYTVGPAIEVLHSYGGGEFSGGVVDNYLESPFCEPAGNQGGSCSNGTGTVNTLLGQYELGLANFGLFEGGRDLRLTLFGMLNYITADDGDEIWYPELSTDAQRQDGTVKLKYGAEAEYFMAPWISAALRGDRLQPHSKVPEQSFSILTAALNFRTQYVTRETISLIYSRYFYAQRECQYGSPADDPYRTSYDEFAPNGVPGRIYCVQPGPSAPDGFGAHGSNQDTDSRGAPGLIPDVNVVTVQARMWW